MDDDDERRGDAPGSDTDARHSRAAYFEQLSARVLRTVDRDLKDHPRPLEELTSLIGELLIELRRAEDGCKTLEQQLRGLTRRHRDLLDGIPVPCFITDEQGIVTRANREALLLLRSSARHMIGKPAVLWFKDRDGASAFMHELQAAARPVHGQLEIAPRDCRSAIASVVAQPVDGVRPPLWRWFLLPDRQPST